MAGHRRFEARAPLGSARTLVRTDDQCQRPVPVNLDQVVHQQLHATVVLNPHGAGSGTGDDVVDEDAGRAVEFDHVHERLLGKAGGAHQQAVHLVLDQES